MLQLLHTEKEVISMLREILMERYEYNEPIFLSELEIDGLSNNALRQAINRLKESGFLQRFDQGIYYIPDPNRLLCTPYLDPELVMKRKYIENKRTVMGYLTGISFANYIGLTTQNPGILELVSNCESSKGREVTLGNLKLRIKKPITEITEQNAKILQLLDGISQAHQYSELSEQETIECINHYVKQQKFTREQLNSVSSYITPSTAKKLIEWGTIYEFAS